MQEAKPHSWIFLLVFLIQGLQIHLQLVSFQLQYSSCLLLFQKYQAVYQPTSQPVGPPVCSHCNQLAHQSVHIATSWPTSQLAHQPAHNQLDHCSKPDSPPVPVGSQYQSAHQYQLAYQLAHIQLTHLLAYIGSVSQVDANCTCEPEVSTKWSGFKLVRDNTDKKFCRLFYHHNRQTISMHAFIWLV